MSPSPDWVAQWVQASTCTPGRCGPFPRQGTYLERGFGSLLGRVWEATNQYFSLTSMFYFSLSLFFFSKTIKKIISLDEG